MFNPQARLQRVDFGQGRSCLVVDDALLDPDALVAHAVAHAGDFHPADSGAYPGVFMPAPPPLADALSGFFVTHARSMFDARRLLHLGCRLSMVTLPPQALRPSQWICHRDGAAMHPRESIQASVLYLFKDEGLGGTSFYEPVGGAEETALLFRDAGTMPAQEFGDKYRLAPSYLNDSNAYFNRIGGVAPRYNRMLFYDGRLLHSGDIPTPEKLSENPATGRLTMNGFFTSSRKAA